MMTAITRMFLFFAACITALQLDAQCNIKSKVNPDGTLFYYIEPVRFYWTEAKQLQGGVITDKENYFLVLQPIPFPTKPDGKKLKEDLEVQLSDGKTYTLEHYDSRYSQNDSVFVLVFLIDKDHLEAFKTNDVEQVKIGMGEEAVRVYNFKLHKAAVREQLICFIEQK